MLLHSRSSLTFLAHLSVSLLVGVVASGCSSGSVAGGATPDAVPPLDASAGPGSSPPDGGAADSSTDSFHGWRAHAKTAPIVPWAMAAKDGHLFLFEGIAHHFHDESWTSELTDHAPFSYETALVLHDGRICTSGDGNELACFAAGSWSWPTTGEAVRMDGASLAEVADGTLWSYTNVPAGIRTLPAGSSSVKFYETLDLGGRFAVGNGKAYLSHGNVRGRILELDLGSLHAPGPLLESDYKVSYESTIELGYKDRFGRLFRTSKGEIVAVGSTSAAQGQVAVLAPGGSWRSLPTNLPPPPDPSHSDPSFASPDGLASDDLWASMKTEAVHFDGASWTKDPASPAFSLATNVFVEGPGHVWVFDGATGVLWERRP